MCHLLIDLQNEFKLLRTKIEVPEEIQLLYKWIEKYGEIEAYNSQIETPNGLVGDPTVYQYGRINTDNEFAPDITFTVEGQSSFKYWFNIPEVTDEISSRLVSFADSGMCGSQLAFWLDDNNKLKIVHMGSEGQLCCVIANNMTEFLSLLTIGYQQLDDVYDFSLSPEELSYGEEIKINHDFVEWIEKKFGIKRPANAAMIVKETPEIGDENTTDPFCLWCNKQLN